mgnify:CR=1 FL=1
MDALQLLSSRSHCATKVMQFKKFAYAGKGAPPAAAAPPRRPIRRTNAQWCALDNDVLLEIFCHMDDRQIARLARLDKRTRRLSRTGVQRHLGLGDSQYEVFRAVLERRESVLLMGTPGSGKSFLLGILKERVRNPLVTASTGAAAEKIGAWTLHSALGLGIGDKTAQQIVAKLLKPNRGVPPCAHHSQRCGAVIIDETSMLTAKLLDLAGEVLVMMRGELPQLIVSGDPMQLGAVAADKEGPFHQAMLVRRLKPYVLTESFRQAEDSMFLRILNRARLGRARETDIVWLRAHFCSAVGKDVPRLFCRLYEVEDYNHDKLEELPAGSLHIYKPTTTGQVPAVRSQRSGPTGQAFSGGGGTSDLELHLKVGARVLLNRNLPEYPTLHNGSCGTVRSLTPMSVGVLFDCGLEARIKPATQEFERDGKVVGTSTKIPLMLAWAVSVHRAQGATLDHMAVDLRKSFAPGQVYVALSRVREAEHAEVAGINLRQLNTIDKAALRFYNKCAERAEARTERHRERARLAELADVQGDDLDDELLMAMMDDIEADGVGVSA